MKIGFVSDGLIGIRGNGIISQAKMWGSLLRSRGFDVYFLDGWSAVSMDDFDIIHIFGSGGTGFFNVAQYAKSRGTRIVWSPICDNIDSPMVQSLKAKLGCEKMQLFSYPYIRKKTYPLVDYVFVRSKYEQNYVHKAYDVDLSKIRIVPLPISYDDVLIDYSIKEDFCLHISSISDIRKNVIRLISAAKKFGFKLVLAGNKGSNEDYAEIEKSIAKANNIEVLGFVSEAEKENLYRKAKTFALPSTYEGVGIVALDAAHFGCSVVITNIGGPKEYYNGKAYEINPYSVDDIGLAIVKAMNETKQPELKQWIDSHYSKDIIAEVLEREYWNLLGKV